MPTDPDPGVGRAAPRSPARRRRRRFPGSALAAVVLAAGSVPALPVAGQAPLFLIDNDTRVSSVGVEFAGTRTLPTDAIRERIALAGPGVLEELQAALDVLPLISAPEPHLFSPLEMARDAARIERLYRERGFLGPEATYRVVLDTASNAVSVTYRIDEGRPLLLDSLVLRPGAASAPLDSALVPDWLRFVDDLRGARDRRLGDVERVRLRSRSLDWLRSRGYPFARVSDTLQVDSATATVRLIIDYDPGSRARVDAVEVEGVQALSPATVRREIPLAPGDWFSAGRMVEGQRQIFGLALVRQALLDVGPDQPRDSTVTLRARVREGSPRLVSGELGYATERGAVAQGNWEHRDFLGGGRTLSVTGTANTGWLAATEAVDRRYGLSTALRQPWLFDYRVSGVLRPFAEYRDDSRDESVSFGTDVSVLFERGSLKLASATWTLSTRRIIDAPTLAARGDAPDTLLFAVLPVGVSNVRTHRIGLSAVYGEVDDPMDPRQGYIARAAVEVAGPEGLSDVQYGRVDGSLAGFLPLGSRVGLVARASGGRLLPWGASVPQGPDDLLPVLIRLRDAVFTAGGTGDVRGWGAGLLGPKVPDLRVVDRGDTVQVSADRWLVLEGLARATGSLELRLPFPFLGPEHGTHLFIDAGRIWNPDDRFFSDPDRPGDPLGQDGVFYGAGFGVEFGTLVGPLRIDLGYKLNPSPLDLRDPEGVARALLTGRPISTVPADPLRRWQLHLAIGRVY